MAMEMKSSFLEEDQGGHREKAVDGPGDFAKVGASAELVVRWCLQLDGDEEVGLDLALR